MSTDARDLADEAVTLVRTWLADPTAARPDPGARRLAALLEQCQQANLRNGRIIRNNQHATGRLLDILRGQDTPSLYDRRGGATQGSRQRPLSQA